MLTQRSGTADSGSGTPAQALMKFRDTATTLTTSWNCKNLRMLWYTLRPHNTALAIDLILSSRITISHDSLAVSVPSRPSANPTSASFSAGASFVPSPVTATTSPSRLCCLTSISLSVGVERASTRMSSATRALSSLLIFRNTGPSITAFGPSTAGSRIPTSSAMNLAVRTLSPVTIRTVTPAPRSSSTASLDSGRIGSLIPTMPSSVRWCSGASSQKSLSTSGPARSMSRYARSSVRSPRFAMDSMRSWIRICSPGANMTVEPSAAA
mmetsp:Transcript_1332/g.3649  ORF Transcript_1332/g.3649 Transcript_1332/m.3649 type:complete len:268 (-) Transcript_1332:1697-2500(-)